MDAAPQGPSNPADVASVGQQQTLPGGTNAEKRTGTAQRVRLLIPHTHRETHTQTQPLATHSICTICQDCAELHSTPGWSWQPAELPLICNDSIFYTWFHTRPLLYLATMHFSEKITSTNSMDVWIWVKARSINVQCSNLAIFSVCSILKVAL